MYQSPSVTAEFGPFVWIQYWFPAGGSSTAVAVTGVRAIVMAARNASGARQQPDDETGADTVSFTRIGKARASYGWIANRLAPVREERELFGKHVYPSSSA